MTANVSHPAFSQPDDENIVIWRYMDFAKYVAMLSTKKLYFSRADKLGDPYEGSLTRRERKSLEERARAQEMSGDLPLFWKGKFFEVLMHAWRAAIKENYVLCWHMNPGESEAMWKLYASGQGVAIRSTYRALVNSLPSNYSPVEFAGPYVGKVSYINYEEENFDSKNMFYSLLHKRLSFKHENECRAVIWKHGNYAGPDPVPLEVLEKNEAGIFVKASLEQLISCVVVSPKAHPWFSDLVTEVTKMYGYNFDVIPSQQDLEPYL